MRITALIAAILAFLACSCSASKEVADPFTPGGCVNEYSNEFMFDVDSDWYILQAGAQVQAPHYEAGEEQPEILIMLQRRTPTENETAAEAAEKKHEPTFQSIRGYWSRNLLEISASSTLVSSFFSLSCLHSV